MRRIGRIMGRTLLVLLLGFVGLSAYVRLAPSDPARWHVALVVDADAPWDQVTALEGGATLRLSPAKGAPADLLAKLDTIALATPRTQRLAGSVEDGRITWITRTRMWGFPDYTTAEVRPDGLYLHARLRFGKSDLGVNAARLTDWLSRL